MVFVENGRVVERRSMMRAGTISDIFWGLLNTIYAFFHCMFSVCTQPCRKCECMWAFMCPNVCVDVQMSIVVRLRLSVLEVQSMVSHKRNSFALRIGNLQRSA